MQLLTRREYNLILRSLDKYELYMNNKEKELSEKLQLCYSNSVRFRNLGYTKQDKVYQVTNKKTAEMPHLGNNN